LLNFKGVAQENVKTKDHNWKNTIHNNNFKLEEENKFHKALVKPKPVRRIDPNDKETMNRLLKLSAPVKHVKPAVNHNI
jgi:hypothetical protein